MQLHLMKLMMKDLMKPMNVPFAFFSDGGGQTLLHALLILPSIPLALLFVHIDVPSSPVLGAFVLTFFLGYLVNFFLNFLMNVVAFWTLETFAMQLMVRWASDLLSGQIFPLTFFPGALGAIVQALPFAAIYWTPLRIYVGELPPAGWAAAVGTQLLWLSLFSVLSVVVWRMAERRVIVQGG